MFAPIASPEPDDRVARVRHRRELRALGGVEQIGIEALGERRGHRLLVAARTSAGVWPGATMSITWIDRSAAVLERLGIVAERQAALDQRGRNGPRGLNIAPSATSLRTWSCSYGFASPGAAYASSTIVYG